MTTKELLAKYNELTGKNIKVWKASRKALEDKLFEAGFNVGPVEPKPNNTPETLFADQPMFEDAAVSSAELDATDGVKAKRLVVDKEKPVASVPGVDADEFGLKAGAKDKKKRVKSVKVKKVEDNGIASVAQVAIELGMNPKVVRAKLRRHRIKWNGKNLDEVTAILRGDKRHKSGT